MPKSRGLRCREHQSVGNRVRHGGTSISYGRCRVDAKWSRGSHVHESCSQLPLHQSRLSPHVKLATTAMRTQAKITRGDRLKATDRRMIEFVSTREVCIGGMDRMGIDGEYLSYKSIGKLER